MIARHIFFIIAACFLAISTQAQVINSFPHFENFETWPMCQDTCGSTCTFLGGWTNGSTASIEWLTDTSGTPSPLTGPIANGGADHNPGTSSGKYVYTESSGLCSSDSAFFETPLVDLTGVINPEMSFYYHCHGLSVDSLYLDYSIDSGSTWVLGDTSFGGVSQDTWLLVTRDLSPFLGQIMKFRISAYTSGSFQDYALDDFAFTGIQDYDAGIDSVFASSGFCVGDSSEVCINIHNFGQIPIDSLTIFTTVNSAPFFSPYTYVGPPIPAGGDTIICLGKGLFSTGDTIVSYSFMPNGFTDTVNTNDTTQIIVLVSPNPTASAGNDTIVCPQVSVNLGGSPSSPTATSFLWSPSTNLSSSTVANPNATFIAGGVYPYELTVTDSTLCQSTDSVYITVTPVPTVDAGMDTTVCLFDSISLGGVPTGPLGASYIWGNGAVLNNDTLANPTAYIPASLQFTVQVTDSFGCSFYDTVNVLTFPNPALDAGDDLFLCTGDSVVLGGSPLATNFISVAWTPAATVDSANIANPSAFPSIVTTYYVTIVDTNGCSFDDSVVVTPIDPPVIDAGNDTLVCAFAQFSVGGSPTGPANTIYSWSPAGLFVDPEASNPLLTVTSDTTLFLLATDTITGCISRDTVNITIEAIPNVDVGTDSIALCYGDTTTIGGSPTGPASASYLWSPSFFMNDSSLANPILTALSSIHISVLVTDTITGCTNADSLYLTTNTPPDANAGVDTTICPMDSVQLGGSPTSFSGTTFSWAPSGTLNNASLSNPLAFPNSPTTFYVTVTDINNCESVDSVIITLDTLPIAIVSIPTPVCQGDSTQLQASGGISYVWDNPGVLSNDTIANPLAAPSTTTLFTVSVTDGNQCSDTAQVQAVIYALPPVSAGANDTICIGFAAQLDGSGAQSYVWSPAASLNNSSLEDPIATPTQTTQYNLVATDSNGCTNQDSTIVVVNTLPTADAGNDEEICLNQSQVIGGSPTGPAGSTYLWSPSTALNSNSSANPAASPTASGVFGYEVEVTDVNGCVDTDSMYLTVYALPVASIVPVNDTTCPGVTVGLQASGGVSYAWGPNQNIANANSATPTVIPPVTSDYIVTVTDIHGCTDTDTITVPRFPDANANAGNNVEICLFDSVELSATGGNQFQWSPTNKMIGSNSSNPTVYPIVTTEYTVTVTNASGCTGTDEVQVKVNPLPVVSAGFDETICFGLSTRIGGSPTGPSGSSYDWQPTTGLNNPGARNPVASPDTTTRYTVVVTSSKGCIDRASVTVFVNMLPSVEIQNPPFPICSGDSVWVSATPGFEDYTWSPEDAVGLQGLDSTQLFPSATSSYIVAATDTNGCIGRDTGELIVNQLPMADAGLDRSVCNGDSIELKGKGGVQYLWAPGAFVNDSLARVVNAFPSTTTDFILRVTDTNGCHGYDTVNTRVFEKPFAEAGDDIESCDGAVVTIGGNPSGPSNASFSWTPQAGLSNPYVPNPQVVSDQRTKYELKVEDRNGCVGIDSVLVDADCFAIIYAPTAFTPGFNQVNDEFLISGYRINSTELKIYDRWGRLVFETTDLNIGWNGKHFNQGEIMQASVYHWVLTYKSETSRKLTKDGFVTLIR